MITKWILKRQLRKYEASLMSLELAIEFCHVDESNAPSLLEAHTECRAIYDGLRLLLKKVNK